MNLDNTISVVSKNKVWMIIPSFYPALGGAEVQAQQLSKALLKKGWAVNILTRRHISGFSGLSAKEIVGGVPVNRSYSWGKGKIGSVFFMIGGLWHILWHGRGDIFHAHGEGASAWMAVLAARLFGGRSLIKLRTGVYVYQRQYFHGFAGWQFRKLLRMTGLIIVVNQEVRKWLIDTLGISSEKIRLVPNSVDVVAFYPVPVEKKEAQRKQLSLPMDKKIYLFVGRLNHLKGVDLLLKAWSAMPKALCQEMLLLLVGDGSDYQKLKKMREELGITDSVRMLGLKQNVRDYYWSADVFVLPSRTEGLSNALVEAMACGLPSVVSAVGGGPDLIVDGENGYLAEGEDCESLTNKLVKSLHAQDEWDEMGRRARKTILSEYDLKTNAARFHQIYLSLFQSR